MKIDGILLTIVDSRANFAREIAAPPRETYGGKIKVFRSEIPHSVRAKETSAEGKSIFAHDPGGLLYINTFPRRTKRDHAGADLAVMEPIPHQDDGPHTATRRFFGSLYLTAGHRRRMEKLKARLGHRRGRDTPAHYAVTYLLTANENLYRHTANCFCRYGIAFAYATLRDMPPHDYTLFSAAKDIYSDTPRHGAGGPRQ